MTVVELKQSASRLLQDNILPFWLNRMQDAEHGGFYGRIDGHGVLHPLADKGSVLGARILWTFAAAYRVLHRPEYLEAALRAKEYILRYFIDAGQGGVVWAVGADGKPTATKKQSYAIGFTIYGMSELARANGDTEALQCAIQLFRDLECHAFDSHGPGYIEALTRDWQPLQDMRLSDKDENGSRTMNTHLHILEPYTNLYRVWKDKQLELQLRTLIAIFTDKLFNTENHHLDLFFDDNWQGRHNIHSYGHDIEAAWLLTEALEVLSDTQLTHRVMPIVLAITQAAGEGICSDGSMIHERNLTTGHADTDRHWWVQCENVIGQVNAYQHFHDPAALQRVLRCYQYILDHLVDREEGEWFWSIRADGSVNVDEDKAGPWKCPYHNSRMCLELIERL